MAFGPNFEPVVQLGDTELTIGGRSDFPPAPLHLHVFLEQGGQVKDATVEVFQSEWHASLPGEGFEPGAARAFGVEFREDSLQTTAWSQTVTIE